MINKGDYIDGGLIFTGIGVSLIDIQNILAIVLLIFEISWLILKFIIKLFKYLSDGKLTEEEIKDLDNDMEKIKEKGDE